MLRIMKNKSKAKIEAVHLILVVDHPHILITTVAKRSEDKWRDEVSEFLELSLRVAMSEEDVRHATRPIYGVHFGLDTQITTTVVVVVTFVVIAIVVGIVVGADKGWVSVVVLVVVV